MKDVPAVAARMGLALPMIAMGARVLESTFGRPTCFGRYCIGRGATGYHEILFALIAIGALAAFRTACAGPSRWMGIVGFVLASAALFASPFALEFPALRNLWP